MAKLTKNKVRLSSDVIPTKYSISLKPDLEAFVFEGKETIDMGLNMGELKAQRGDHGVGFSNPGF